MNFKHSPFICFLLLNIIIFAWRKLDQILCLALYIVIINTDQFNTSDSLQQMKKWRIQ